MAKKIRIDIPGFYMLKSEEGRKDVYTLYEHVSCYTYKKEEVIANITDVHGSCSLSLDLTSEETRSLIYSRRVALKRACGLLCRWKAETCDTVYCSDGMRLLFIARDWSYEAEDIKYMWTKYRNRFRKCQSKQRVYSCKAYNEEWSVDLSEIMQSSATHYVMSHVSALRSYNTIIAFTDLEVVIDALRFEYGYTATSAQHFAKWAHWRGGHNLPMYRLDESGTKIEVLTTRYHQ
jgi:hypothetical protein